jgi:outer membrane biogenesis lipoprotein LolB
MPQYQVAPGGKALKSFTENKFIGAQMKLSVISSFYLHLQLGISHIMQSSSIITDWDQKRRKYTLHNLSSEVEDKVENILVFQILGTL